MFLEHADFEISTEGFGSGYWDEETTGVYSIYTANKSFECACIYLLVIPSLIFLLSLNHSSTPSPRQISLILALPPKPTSNSYRVFPECNIRKQNLVLAPNYQRILFPYSLFRLTRPFKSRPSSSLLYSYAKVYSALHNMHFLIHPKSSPLLPFKLQVMVRQHKLPIQLGPVSGRASINLSSLNVDPGRKGKRYLDVNSRAQKEKTA
ncbi:hypothetical protein K435DRAFT_845367 [Dendrothele bispora CBS 962.96]|uniref:Uncharacterized protein n=1 Tax=Dendrothele bispora (strain CBS 962.96) TaxID=1314807 RepID=A0A4S8KVY7_DENBC|nr:hypothetical protein K435DRAFT_845367 [Dendrothele bispora CBS 962.96]